MKLVSSLILCMALCSSVALAQEESNLNLGGTKLSFETADNRFEYNIGGMILLDHVLFEPDLSHTELTQNSSGRAIRFNIDGKLYDKWAFKAQYDFAGDVVNIRHAWIQYDFSSVSSLRMGQQGTSQGMQSAAAINNLFLMERSLGQRPSTWGKRFSKGISFHTSGEYWQGTLGVFENEDESANKDPDRGRQYFGRATTAPLSSSSQVLHFGAFAGSTHYENDAHPRFRTTPVGTSLTNLQIVDTGTLTTGKSFQLYGGEFLYAYNQFSLMSEYQAVTVNRGEGESDLSFSGYNADLMWFITGERIPYKKNQGTWGALKPSSIFEDGGTGAVALVLRYDTIDLQDKDVDGGKETDMTLGVTWWPNPAMKFMVQYTKSKTEKAAVKDDPSAVGMRMQITF